MAYLRTEVPRWRREHPCYSCHNNGDATRALLAAAAQGHDIGTALDDTLAWLAAPGAMGAERQPGRVVRPAARARPVRERAERGDRCGPGAGRRRVTGRPI